MDFEYPGDDQFFSLADFFAKRDVFQEAVRVCERVVNDGRKSS